MTVRVVALDDYQGLVEQYSLAGGRPGPSGRRSASIWTATRWSARWTARP